MKKNLNESRWGVGTILLKNGRVIDVTQKRIEKKDIAIKGNIIISVDEGIEYDEVIDLRNSYIAPGLIDGHLHIESSMLTPIEFSFEAIKNGTTSVFVDPHEIANVLGRKGVDLFLEIADCLPFTMNIGIPSCVPATHLETAGGSISLKDIEELIDHPNVFGLAEMMNFPGIVHGITDAREKVDFVISRDKIVDGHCPALTGKDLLTYISNGKNDGKIRIGSDHECTNAKEALEKMDKGMYIMLRHGSSAKDLEKILPEVARSCFCLDKFGLVSDDLSAYDLRRRGHINHLVKIAADIIADETENTLEEAVIEAIAMGSINHARYFRKNIGILEPGAIADIIVFNSLKEIKPDIVISRGNIVVRDKKVVIEKPSFDFSLFSHPIILQESVANRLFIHSEKEKEKVRVISIEEDSLFTTEEILTMKVQENIVDRDKEDNILKVAVIERHRGTGNISVGFVKGFNFNKGAIAGTVAHDSHNLIVVGSSEVAMNKAINKIKKIGGGLVAVYEEDSAYVSLDLAGLMSTQEISIVLQEYERLHTFLQKNGFKNDPFPAISFIALPVIPKLKITDKGLVDIEKFDFVDLFVE